MKNLPAIAAVLVLVAGGAYWQWHRTQATPAPAAASAAPTSLADIAREANAALPQPHADGFVIRSVRVDGRRLVTDIASPDIDLAKIDMARLPQIRSQEQQDLVAASCGDPAVLALMHDGVTVVRRFLDMQDKLIFEIEVTSKFCGRELL